MPRPRRGPVESVPLSGPPKFPPSECPDSRAREVGTTLPRGRALTASSPVPFLRARRHFGSSGASVAIIDVQEDKLKSAVEALEAKGIKATYVALNVTDPEAWKAAAKTVHEKFGRIDILVQAAGVTGKTGASRGDSAHAREKEHSSGSPSPPVPISPPSSLSFTPSLRRHQDPRGRPF